MWSIERYLVYATQYFLCIRASVSMLKLLKPHIDILNNQIARV